MWNWKHWNTTLSRICFQLYRYVSTSPTHTCCWCCWMDLWNQVHHVGEHLTMILLGKAEVLLVVATTFFSMQRQWYVAEVKSYKNMLLNLKWNMSGKRPVKIVCWNSVALSMVFFLAKLHCVILLLACCLKCYPQAEKTCLKSTARGDTSWHEK